MDHDNCPRCDVSLVGDRIPDKHLSRVDLETGETIPYVGPPQFYRHTILVEIPGVYDGGLFYACPSCGGAWHRWPEDHYLYKRADIHVRAQNERMLNL